MRQTLFKSKDYCVCKVDETYLRKIATFVVHTNYIHHNHSTELATEEEIESIYQEELSYSENSQLFVAEDHNKNIIGCIRVMRWDKKTKLPIEKIFGIRPTEILDDADNKSIWHVGRFAISAHSGIQTLSLFKQLMIYAITPICQEISSYMIAECDSKLLRIMSMLGIRTENLQEGVFYLGSETIPVIAGKDGLTPFYELYHHLCCQVEGYQSKSEAA